VEPRRSGSDLAASCCRNHAPLIIAEHFGRLESLYEGRIDLGLGRAPGTDQRTARALRRDLALAYSVVGTPDTVKRGLEAFIAETQGNELMLTAQIYDQTARLRSLEIAAEARDRAAAPGKLTSMA
jgi:alkanesulfonate monooxygenase SsuD/methylene tetrahydromethanopterin reductase-like flavin-dependent oxidoreductase (luciferase family)